MTRVNRDGWELLCAGLEGYRLGIKEELIGENEYFGKFSDMLFIGNTE